jgi:hypothetical protein
MLILTVFAATGQPGNQVAKNRLRQILFRQILFRRGNHLADDVAPRKIHRQKLPQVAAFFSQLFSILAGSRTLTASTAAMIAVQCAAVSKFKLWRRGGRYGAAVSFC